MLLWSLVLGAWNFSVCAQTPLSNLVYAVGTTVRDNLSQDWSYVLLDSSDPQTLAGKRFAVYGKPGYPADAGTFTLRGNLVQETGVAAINTKLNQSVALGQNLASLNDALASMVGTNVIGLLRKVPGITNQTLPQKVLTAFQLAATDQSIAEMLALLEQGNPGLNLCAERAFSEMMSTVTTYEVRELDPGSGAAGNVVGRVTLVPNAPVVLPAPGKPFQVVSNQMSEHLLIRLRWGTPPELRRLSVLNVGFNLWRIPKAAAEAGNFHINPPTPAVLHANVNFVQANRATVFATMDYHTGSGAGAADDPADRITFFFADSGRGSGSPPFNDGEQFYYFATARDLLGRDGLVSPGGLARACRRLPPKQPTDVRVVNTVLPGSTNQPRLQVNWVQNTNAADLVTHYWIYRWPNPTMALTNDATPMNFRVGVVTNIPGTNFNSFIDTGAGAMTNANITNVWFTVRAVSEAACDPLLSPHAGPAWGVLRQRDAPDATSGEVLGSCGALMVKLTSVYTNTLAGTNTEGPRSRIICVRRDPGVAWVEFFIGNDAPYSGRIYFPPDGDRIEIQHAQPLLPALNLYVTCKVGNAYGNQSVAAIYTRTNGYPNNSELQIEFLAGQLLATALSSSDPLVGLSNCVSATSATPDASGMVAVQFPLPPLTTALVQAQTNGVTWTDVALLTSDSNSVFWVSYPACLIGPVPPFRACQVNLTATDCDRHVVGAADDGPTAPIRVRFKLKPRTREYRVYRRVDAGPLTLLAQGAAAYDPAQPNKVLETRDEAMPSVAARICFFVQLLDEHGNGSPLAFIGCRQTAPRKFPVPTLSEPAAAGNANQPQVALTWFCPTSGVYRFQFKLHLADSQGGTQPSGFAAPKLSRDLLFDTTALYAGLTTKGSQSSTLVQDFATDVAAVTANGLLKIDEAHLTSPIGANFGPGPQFTLTASVRANTSYLISVAAVDEQGTVGPGSPAWEFTWRPPIELATVPWPARRLPRVSENIDLATVINTTNLYPRYPVGVVIGVGPAPFFAYASGLTNNDYLPGQPPTRYLIKTADGRPLLPAVLYRMQVTNALFPRVSGDMVQCSPLIETIPWFNPCLSGTFDGPCTVSRIRDPLIRAIYYAFIGPEVTTYGFSIVLLDTQPVISGASYRYSLVRFDNKREPDTIIPCGEVDVP